MPAKWKSAWVGVSCLLAVVVGFWAPLKARGEGGTLSGGLPLDLFQDLWDAEVQAWARQQEAHRLELQESVLAPLEALQGLSLREASDWRQAARGFLEPVAHPNASGKTTPEGWEALYQLALLAAEAAPESKWTQDDENLSKRLQKEEPLDETALAGWVWVGERMMAREGCARARGHLQGAQRLTDAALTAGRGQTWTHPVWWERLPVLQGDCALIEGQAKTALVHYQLGFSRAQASRLGPWEGRSVAEWEGHVRMRLIWAHWRAGESQEAVLEGVEWGRLLAREGRWLPSAAMRETWTLVGSAWAEDPSPRLLDALKSAPEAAETLAPAVTAVARALRESGRCEGVLEASPQTFEPLWAWARVGSDAPRFWKEVWSCARQQSSQVAAAKVAQAGVRAAVAMGWTPPEAPSKWGGDLQGTLWEMTQLAASEAWEKAQALRASPQALEAAWLQELWMSLSQEPEHQWACRIRRVDMWVLAEEWEKAEGALFEEGVGAPPTQWATAWALRRAQVRAKGADLSPTDTKRAQAAREEVLAFLRGQENSVVARDLVRERALRAEAAGDLEAAEGFLAALWPNPDSDLHSTEWGFVLGLGNRIVARSKDSAHASDLALSLLRGVEAAPEASAFVRPQEDVYAMAVRREAREARQRGDLRGEAQIFRLASDRVRPKGSLQEDFRLEALRSLSLQGDWAGVVQWVTEKPEAAAFGEGRYWAGLGYWNQNQFPKALELLGGFCAGGDSLRRGLRGDQMQLATALSIAVAEGWNRHNEAAELAECASTRLSFPWSKEAERALSASAPKGTNPEKITSVTLRLRAGENAIRGGGYKKAEQLALGLLFTPSLSKEFKSQARLMMQLARVKNPNTRNEGRRVLEEELIKYLKLNGVNSYSLLQMKKISDVLFEEDDYDMKHLEATEGLEGRGLEKIKKILDAQKIRLSRIVANKGLWGVAQKWAHGVGEMAGKVGEELMIRGVKENRIQWAMEGEKLRNEGLVLIATWSDKRGSEAEAGEGVSPFQGVYP